MAITKEIVWVEKYRPHKISDCILPENLKNTFQGIINSGKFPNMILSGTSGTGKTTVVQALSEELQCDFLKINASENGNIDTLRNQIRNFASTSSIEYFGARKVLLLDEADGLNATSTQPALRAFIEEFSSNTSFVLTVNYKNKVIPALHSRCPVIDFKFPKAERPILAKAFLKRLEEILKTENVPYDKKVLVELISKLFPDFRAIIGKCQEYSLAGKIDIGLLSNLAETKISELVKSLKEKDFGTMRKWVANNLDSDITRILRMLYDQVYDYLQPSSIPQAVILISDGMKAAPFSPDQEILLAGTLTVMMDECEFL